jgi:hypothetical protein
MKYKDVLFILENVDFEIPGNDQQEVINFVKQSHDRERVLEKEIQALLDVKRDFSFEAITNRDIAYLKENQQRAEKELEQADERERVLREALQTIFNATSKRDYSTNEFNTVHRYAKEALEASR